MITQLLRAVGYSTVAFLNVALLLPGSVEAASPMGRVVVLLDATSTMSLPCGTMSRFDVARWCLSDVLDLTPNGTPFCFVLAGNGGHLIENFDAMSPDTRCEIRRKVMRVSPAGTTSLAGCFTDPRMTTPTSSDQTTIVVMITDGQHCQVGATSAAVTRWQQNGGRTVQSLIVGPCTEATVVEPLAQFASSCGATFTQCPTAQRLHKPLTDAFQLCFTGCNSNHDHTRDACAANQRTLVELQERLTRIENDTKLHSQSLSQLNYYVGSSGESKSPLTQAIFGNLALHFEGNRDRIRSHQASLEEVKEGIRRTARFIGYDVNSESLRSVNNKIHTDTTRIKNSLEENERLIQATVDRLSELQTSLGDTTSDLPDSIKVKLSEVIDSLSSTQWATLMLSGLAVLFSGTAAAGGTWGVNRLVGVVQRQDRTNAEAAQDFADDLSRQAAEYNGQLARVLESLATLNDRLDERVRRTVADVAATQTVELREALSRDRDAVAHTIEKNEAAMHLLLQTSFDTQRERLGTAINECLSSIKADMSRLDQTVDTTGTKSSELLAKVARRVDKCAASIANAESTVRDRAEGLKEQIHTATNRQHAWNLDATQQLDAMKQSLSSLDQAVENRQRVDVVRWEQLCAEIREQVTKVDATPPARQDAAANEPETTRELDRLRKNVTRKLKRFERILRRQRPVSAVTDRPKAESDPSSDDPLTRPNDPVADLLRIDTLSREHANRLFEQGVQSLSQLAGLDEASILRISHAIPFLGTVGLYKLRTRARGIISRES